jgi:predicted Fe-S protein YdhL (DUF1289 family)
MVNEGDHAPEDGMDVVFAALARSSFRRRFRLRRPELEYVRAKTLPVVLRHAAELIGARLAPAAPANDGRQTPMRGHPVFVAQHATATCCRGCLFRWHHVPRGRALTDEERRRVVAVLEKWLRAQLEAAGGEPDGQARLDGQIELEMG